MDRRTLGNKAEARARIYLEAQGLQLICTNFNCKVGELDIVAMDSGILAVIEVRSRTNMGYGTAAESIGWHKRQRIIRATQYFLLKHPQLRRLPVRFDVVTIDKSSASSESKLTWIRNAFSAT